MTHVANNYPEVRLKGPIIEEAFDDAVILRFIDAPHLAERHDLSAWRRHMDRYAQMLVTIDQAAEGYQTEGVDYSNHRTEQIFTVWNKWLGQFAKEVPRLDEAKALVKDYLPAVTTRMQHGDLTPWQIFDEVNTWIIYDGEKCGTDLARYNDLAYGYGRLFTLLRSRESAAWLLNAFIAAAKVDERKFADQLLPIMTARAIGMLSDALHDRITDDYVAHAELLLDLCLTRDISNLRQ